MHLLHEAEVTSNSLNKCSLSSLGIPFACFLYDLDGVACFGAKLAKNSFNLLFFRLWAFSLLLKELLYCWFVSVEGDCHHSKHFKFKNFPAGKIEVYYLTVQTEKTRLVNNLSDLISNKGVRFQFKQTFEL